MTQEQKVMEYITDFGSITALEAMMDLGIMRLASRVADLRMRGEPIVTEMVEVENRYGEKTHIARYRLEES